MTKKEIIAKVNEAFLNADMEGFLAYCTDDFEWDMLGHFNAKGKEKILQFMKEMPGSNTPPDFTVDETIEEGNVVMCQGDMSMMTPEGKPWAGRYCDIYHFRGDQIEHMRSYAVETTSKAEQPE